MEARRHPLLRVTLAYGTGVGLGYWAEPPWPVLLAAAVVLGCSALCLRTVRHLLVPVFCLVAGWCNVVAQSVPVRADDLRGLAGSGAEIVTLRGRLRATPEMRETTTRGRARTSFRAELRVSALGRGGLWIPASGRVLVSTPGAPDPRHFAGRTVEVQGVLRPPGGALAPGLFDYDRYLEEQGIHFELRAGSTDDWCWTADPSDPVRPPLSDRFRRWAQRTLARGLPVEDEPLRLQWAMVLGWKPALTDEVAEPFMRSGTMHIFAISGLHIVLASSILVSLLRGLQLPRAWCGFLVAPVLWFYTAATGWQASALRATLMMTVIIGGWTLRRPGNLLNSLAAAALVILIWDPRQLFQASFQLSFFVVLSLALCLPPLEAWRERLLATDPFLPDSLRPPWQHKLARRARELLTAVAVSFAAWLGSLPLVAAYFHLITPVGLLANLLIVPLSGLALMCGLGSLVCGAWNSMLTEWFNHAGWFWMHCMVRGSEVAAALPGAWSYVVAPDPFSITAYYATLAALASGWAFQRRHGILLAALWLVLCTPGVARLWLQRHDWTLTVLAARTGDALWIDGPGRQPDLLIDTADESGLGAVVAPFLAARGLDRLPAVLLTHGDIRHVGGAGPLLDRFAPGSLLASPARSRSAAYRQALAAADKRGLLRTVQRGDRVGQWTVLHPARGDPFPRADDQAVVLRAMIQGVRVLLCSDLGRLGQRLLLDRETDLRADVVIAGMPNDSEPLTDELLDAVQPRTIVVSTGEYPASRLPSRTLRRRLERRRVPVWFTHEAGSVQLLITPSSWTVQAMQGPSLRLPTPEEAVRSELDPV